MPLNLNSDKLIVVVKPEQQPVVYTGGTTTLLNVGSGHQIYAGLNGTASKIRTLLEGNDVIMSTSGDTIIIGVDTSNLVSIPTFSGYTGQTSNHLQTIDGEILQLSAVTTGLSTTYASKVHTHSYTGNTITDKPTFVGSGGTNVNVVNNQVIISSAVPTGTTVTWNDVVSKPSWLSGLTLNKFQTGHTHSQYATVVNLTGHTSNNSIHFKMSGITINESQVNGLTATLAGKSSTGHSHSYTGSTITDKPTFIGSGGTNVNVVNNQVIISSAIPTGTTVAWNDVVSKPSWLSGLTLNEFESGHTHSQYLTGVTWGQVSGKPALTLESDFTGHTSDNTIHYKQSGITINQSQVSGLTATLAGKSSTGHTHSQYATVVNLTGHTSDSSIHFKMSGITINESQVSGLIVSLAGKSSTGHTHTGVYLPASGLTGYWDSGQTQTAINIATTGLTASHNALSDLDWSGAGHTGTADSILIFDGSGNASVTGNTFYSKSGHTHNQYATVVNLTGHTSDSTIHYKQSGITISIGQVSGLTSSLAGKSSTGHTHSQYATVVNLTGHTSDSTIHFKQSGITINQSQVTGLATSLAGKTDTGTTATLRSNFNTFTGNTNTLYVDNKLYRGFVDGGAINASYDWANRRITLTGNLDYYWNGQKKTFTSPKTFTTGHTATVGHWYLYSSDGTNFAWSQIPWGFTDMQVAHVYYQSTSGATFGIREMHGTMDWNSHEVLHNSIGTYLESGGKPFAYTGATATNSANSPSFAQAVINDEDLDNTIAQWDKGSYTLMRVSGLTKSIYYLNAPLPFSGANNTNMFVNNPSTGAFAAGATNNRWHNVYQILVPVTSDAPSQKYRMIMLQPQLQYTSLAAAQAENVNGLYLGDLTSSTAEFVIYTRITYLTAGSSNYGKCTIAGVSYNVGNHMSNISIVGGASASNHANLANLNFTDSGHVGTADTLASFNASGIATDLPKATYSLSGHTHAGVYATVGNAVTGITSMGTGTTIVHGTPVATNKVQVKSIKTLGGLSISSDANTIILSGGSGASTLNALSDVTITSVADKQVLRYSSGTTQWINESTVDIFAHVSDGQFLKRSGSTIVGGTAGGVTVPFSGVTGAVNTNSNLQAALDLKANILANISAVTGTTYTVQASDSGKILEFTNTAAVTVTLPTGLTTNFQTTIVNYGGASSGVKTIAAGTGATLKSANAALKLATQYGAATAYYRGSNVWVVFGDLTS